MPLLGPHRRLIALAYLAGAVHQLLALGSAGIGAYVVALAAAIADVEQIELFFAHTLSPLAEATTVPVATTIVLGGPLVAGGGAGADAAGARLGAGLAAPPG